MNYDAELTTLLQKVAEKSLKIIADVKDRQHQLPMLLNQYIDLTEHFQNLVSVILKNPEKVWQMQLAYWEDAFNLAQTQFNHWLEGKSMPISDTRFSGDEWLHNPFFNFLSQHYLLASAHMNSLFKNMEYDDLNSAKRLKFFTKQYLDALSPTNFLHTNPELLD